MQNSTIVHGSMEINGVLTQGYCKIGLADPQISCHCFSSSLCIFSNRISTLVP